MVNDISRAFFHAPAKRKVYVQLPPEDQGKGQEGLCGRLNYSMYGARGAAQNWFDAYSQQFIEIGFHQGTASPCTFYHPQRSIRTYVHGDDYVSTGHPHQLKWLQNQVEKKYQVKTQTLGPHKEQLQQVKILNRVITWDANKGIGYEADPRHVEIINQQLVLDNAKVVATPGAKEEGRTGDDNEEPLAEEHATKYRALVARCNYLSFDRPDIAFAVKALARHMSMRRRGDWTRLKRLGRYVVGKTGLQQWFIWQSTPKGGTTYTGADWAGCRETRKSITGGVIKMGEHTIESWSKTQALIALSSGEFEFYATLKASAETLGIIPMLNDHNENGTTNNNPWGAHWDHVNILTR